MMAVIRRSGSARIMQRPRMPGAKRRAGGRSGRVHADESARPWWEAVRGETSRNEPWNEAAPRQPVAAVEEKSTSLRAARDITVDAVVSDDLLAMGALPVYVEPMAPRRGGDELDEIGAAVPNGFIGQRRAGQSHAARIDAACGERCHGIAQATVTVATVRHALDQP